MNTITFLLDTRPRSMVIVEGKKVVTLMFFAHVLISTVSILNLLFNHFFFNKSIAHYPKDTCISIDSPLPNIV